MGDFMTPRRHERAETYERFQRRIEGYRQRQKTSLDKYENQTNGDAERQRQETRLLHQRWLDNRAKKVAKTKLSRNDSAIAAGTGGCVNGNNLLHHGQASANSQVNLKFARMTVFLLHLFV